MSVQKNTLHAPFERTIVNRVSCFSVKISLSFKDNFGVIRDKHELDAFEPLS